MSRQENSTFLESKLINGIFTFFQRSKGKVTEKSNNLKKANIHFKKYHIAQKVFLLYIFAKKTGNMSQRIHDKFEFMVVSVDGFPYSYCVSVSVNLVVV